MKFSVGYQQDTRERWIQTIHTNREHVDEIYFAWGGLPNGRSPRFSRDIRDRAIEEISGLAELSIKRNLLFNAMCYGAQATSCALRERVERVIDEVGQLFGLQIVTTTSPFIAEFIKARYPQLEVRASVNMDISSVEGMEYLKYAFDSFYIGRVLNRNFAQIEKLRRWAEQNGKKLSILLNSGCLARCPAHVFHDNLVAHEEEISEGSFGFQPLCQRRIEKSQDRWSLVADSSFIRPEGLKYYEKYFSCAKLATRSNPNPSRILNAYVRGKHSGNILELLEPDFSAKLYPEILDAHAFPDDFEKVTGNCAHDCDVCGYCKLVYENAINKLES